MSSKPFPDSHTTETSATTTTVIVRPYLEFSYLKSVPGILKIVELVLDFLIFICILAGPTYDYGGVGWGTFVAVTAFVCTMVFLWLYLFHIVDLYTVVPWLLVEMTFCALTAFCFLIVSCVAAAGAVRWRTFGRWNAWVVAADLVLCAVWAFNFFIASCVLAAHASNIGSYHVFNPGAYAAAAFFGFVVTACYGFDCFLKFRAWSAAGIANQNGSGTPANVRSVATVH